MQKYTQLSVVSVNVGLPREVQWKGRTVSTGIFKAPIEGRVAIRRLNLDGDRQADLSVHGGPEKAVYVYPAEHYPLWQQEYPEMELPWSMFGENLTIAGGLREEDVYIGDQFQIGDARFVVTQPRFPCYKLGIKFGRDDVLKHMLKNGLTGFYFAVLEEGEVGAGDAVTLIQRDKQRVTVADIVHLYVSDKANVQLLMRAVAVEHLAEGWKEYFNERLDQLTGQLPGS